MISVGLVLPQDRRKEVHIALPREPEYVLVDGDETAIPLERSYRIMFGVVENGIEFRSERMASRKSAAWFVRPLEGRITMRRQTGVRVENVISGRGFHWQKAIDVFLPGILEIRSLDHYLLCINELPFEQYLCCVTASEMGAGCPDAFIESQTIAARSWMLANVEMKHRQQGFDVCNDDCCQRYQGTGYLTDHSIGGAENTRGRVLMFDGKICDARYSKCCGGVIEAFENVWGGRPIPYLRQKQDAPGDYAHPALPISGEESARMWIEDDPEVFCSPRVIPEADLHSYLGSVDEKAAYFRWEFDYSREEILTLLNEKLQLDADGIEAIRPGRRGSSGRITRLTVDYTKRNDSRIHRHRLDGEYGIRKAFHPAFLYSSAFVIDWKSGVGPSGGFFRLRGAGWGHGVGFCQMGALGMSLRGYSTDAILAHYFPGTQITTIY